MLAQDVFEKNEYKEVKTEVLNVVTFFDSFKIEFNC
jgi:hypothetical protein